MMQSGEQKPVLFAVLNWGIGHASRSVPLIRALQNKGIPVILASDGVAADLLRIEFPGQIIHELPTYTIRYSRQNMYRNVLRSLWIILSAIWAEQRWIRAFIRHQPLCAIISDNRYGIRLSGIPSILMSHQFQFYGSCKWADKIGQGIVKFWAQKFNEIWVPDWEGSSSLCSGMAIWKHNQPPAYYLGPLSRFEIPLEQASDKEVDIIAILSGPEPQRTQLEERVSAQLAIIPGNHILIRGTMEKPTYNIDNQRLISYDILPGVKLDQLIARSAMQISRSGYSTIMDLTYSGIPALLIPTPGQIEQEYLAIHLKDKGPWLFQHQDELDIEKAWRTRERWANKQSNRPTGEEASQAVTSFLQRLTSD